MNLPSDLIKNYQYLKSILNCKRAQKEIQLLEDELNKYEKKGWAKSTVVVRFWIISIILAMIGLATLKLR